MLKPPSRRQEPALTRAVAAAICGAVVLGVAGGGAAGLIPGGGSGRSDCYAELDVAGITNPSDRVQKNKIVLCTDGEACDTGPGGDNQCDVRVALCINQTDPNLPDCTPPASLRRVTVTDQRKVKLNLAVPQLLEGSACGAFIDATIPVRVSKKGKVLGPGEAKVKITAHVPKGTKSRSDGDAITIKCFPCTMACSPSTTTTLITTTTTTLVSGCFADTGDGTILDSCTGLQWEKKTTSVDSGPNPADLHDVDNWYTWAGCCNGVCSFEENWCQPNAAAAVTCAAHGGTVGCSTCRGTCDVDPAGLGAITTVWDWVSQLNAANFAGHSDWRLPSEAGRNTCPTCNPRELETILLSPPPCGTQPPCIAPIFGPTVSSLYWSSTSDATTAQYGWYVDFNDGYVSADLEVDGLYVRAVR